MFIENTGFHDVFRKGGYTNDMLFSLEETLNYINDAENNCTICPTIESLNKFWEKYPNGLIEFG